MGFWNVHLSVGPQHRSFGDVFVAQKGAKISKKIKQDLGVDDKTSLNRRFAFGLVNKT